MKATKDIALSPEEVTMAWTAVNDHVIALATYKQWLEGPEGQALPGVETAIKEVSDERQRYVGLRHRLFTEGEMKS